MNKGKNVISLELIVFGLIPINEKIFHANSCTAPKWHNHPQKKRPKIKVKIKANITIIAPGFNTPSPKKRSKNS